MLPAVDGEPFLFPNDLCLGPDGALYLTDSGVVIQEFAPNNQIRPDYTSVYYDGRVYRIDIASGRVEKIDSGIKFTISFLVSTANGQFPNSLVSRGNGTSA